MLYDPKWEKKNDVKFYGMTLSGLVAWLATKPADEEYDYVDPHQCALGQYRASLGRKRVCVPLSTYPSDNCTPGGIFHSVVLDGEPTFGAALIRARAALSSTE